ncbi:hypothetical protein G3480_04325 [Thiorhodococcus mannitoliphagus]|uniref:Uncharacterized protein n=1 Tax=Thiorhodococcus mannitoliphagus TaxID=329406 RepID=A0A6P1DS73_9GAMM|nr:hypothetical protein [Thiorhodococcus mannitoliphagus]
MMRVEEELKHHRELMRQGFELMEKRFEQVDKRFDEMLKWQRKTQPLRQGVIQDGLPATCRVDHRVAEYLYEFEHRPLRSPR